MRISAPLPALLATALALPGCGPRALALPDDPVDKAATCAIVDAAHARHASKQVAGALPFAEQGRMLHYAMLTAAAGDTFDVARASAVTQREPALEPGIEKGKFEDLVAPCAAAFPATTKPATLPADPDDAAIGCYALEAFLSKAIGQKADPSYSKELGDYNDLRQRLDPKVTLALKRKGASGDDAQKQAKSKALAAIVPLGSPMAVMDKCLAAYPAPAKAG